MRLIRLLALLLPLLAAGCAGAYGLHLDAYGTLYHGKDPIAPASLSRNHTTAVHLEVAPDVPHSVLTNTVQALRAAGVDQLTITTTIRN